MAEKHCNVAIFRQAFASCTAFGLAMGMGASAGFSAVTIPQLQISPNETIGNSDEEQSFYLTDKQISWFASLPTFATIFSCIFGGFLGQLYGRRLTMILVAPFMALSFVCQATASEVGLFQLGRLLTGIAFGLVSGPAGTYVSEISDPNWRTSFGGSIGFCFLMGTLVVYTLGAFCHWRTLAWISAVFPILSFVIGIFSPESPTWLVTKGRFTDAKAALKWLKSSEAEVESEFQTLKISYTSKTLNSKGGGAEYSLLTRIRNLLSRKDIWKPLALMMTLMLLQQFCGLSTIAFYAVNVLTESNSNVDEYLGTIIFGISRLASQFLGSYLLLRFPRRQLFVASAGMTGLGMGLLGLTNISDAIKVRALPLISVMVAAIGYQFGLSPIVWSYAAELFPMDARSVLTGFTNCFGNLSIFLVVKTFPSLKDPSVFGLGGAYLFYSSICLVNVVFGLCFLPETKGKHLEEINKEFDLDNEETKKEKERLGDFEKEISSKNENDIC